ncbi:MAG TPA: hypothetical protein VFQ88_11470, partial [Nevskiaceae bacterium]|nr:hypothetical protein [Nevskiaceae bacterium]
GLHLPVRRECLLKSPLEHYSWRDYQHLQQKHLEYAMLLARQKYAAGKRGNLAMATLRLFTDFFQQYLLRLSVLDGWRGFLMSVVLAQYAFHKYAALKTLEIQDQQSDNAHKATHRP